MIKMFRIDERLIHGQIAIKWCAAHRRRSHRRRQRCRCQQSDYPEKFENGRARRHQNRDPQRGRRDRPCFRIRVVKR